VFQWLQAVFFFFAAFAFAPLARCAAAILFLAAAVMVRLAGAGLVFIPTDILMARAPAPLPTLLSARG